MFAYRLIHDVSFFINRSFCPNCHATLAWYDLIPIVSWIRLGGKCRSCKKPISPLYPLIELLTVVSLSLVWLEYTNIHYVIAYSLFFSALIVTIRSDFEVMQISPLVTLWLLPFTFIAAYLGYLPITLSDSVYGALFGFFILQSVNLIYRTIKKQDGIGDGDHMLLAFIGSWIGIFGCWATILIGSLLGCAFAFALLITQKIDEPYRTVQIPYGSFLALAAMLFVLYQDFFYSILFFHQ